MSSAHAVLELASRGRTYWAGLFVLGLMHSSCGQTKTAPGSGGAGGVAIPGGNAGARPSGGVAGTSSSGSSAGGDEASSRGGVSAGGDEASSVGGASAGAGSDAGGNPTAGGATSVAGAAGEAGLGGVTGSILGDGGAAGNNFRADCPDASDLGNPCAQNFVGPNTCLYAASLCVCASFGPGPYDMEWRCVPRDCPASAPQGAACGNVNRHAQETGCSYPPEVCKCDAPPAELRRWACFVPLECPEETPVTLEACTPVDSVSAHNECVYGSTHCYCRAPAGSPDAPAWICGEQ